MVGCLSLSPSLPLREQGKGVPDSAYVGKEVEIIKACPLADAQLAPGLPPEGLGGRLLVMEGLEGDMAYYMSDPAHCLLPEQDVSRPMPEPRVMVESQEPWRSWFRSSAGMGSSRRSTSQTCQSSTARSCSKELLAL